MKLVIYYAVICFLGVKAAPPDITFGMSLRPEPVKLSNRIRLTEDLRKNYKKENPPSNVSVSFGISLYDFQVLEDKQALSTQTWITEEWVDNRLTWNPDDYGSITYLSWKSNWIWKPEITFFNSKDTEIMGCWVSNVVIMSNGSVTWMPTCSMTSSCKFDPDTYAESTCALKFGFSAKNGLEIDLNLKEAKIQLDELKNTSGFEIVKNEAKKNVYPELPNLDLTYKLTFKRIKTE